MVIKKVALYLRKSRKDEGNESREETLARHERMLRDYCKNNNLSIVAVYRELVSAENLEDRPQALQMLDDVADGLFDGVVVIELERLSRGNQIDQVEVLETFKKSQTLIYTLNKVYDLSSEDEMDEEFFEFGLYMSRREYKTIKRRLMRGKKQALKEGYYIASTLPFGFGKKRGDKGFVLTPNEQTPIVQLIFDKFVADGWSLAQIRDYLNNAKIRTQLGSNWTVVIVKKILKNKCYIGYLNYNQRGEKSCIKGKHAPIVDVDIFEKAQAKLALASHRVKRSRELVNPLASLVKCSKCGFTMQKTNSVFRCKNIACDMVSSLFVVVEKKIIDELKVELKNFNYFLENYGEEIEKKRTSASRELKLLQKEIDKKDKMLTRACEMLELGVYSQEKYLERVNVLESDKKALQGQISALEVAFNGEDMKIKKAIPILEKCLDEYWKLSPQQKNDLLKSFIDRVEYTKTKRLNGWTVKNDDLELKIYLKI